MAQTADSNPYPIERQASVIQTLAAYLLDIHLRLTRSEARDAIIDQGAQAIADRGTRFLEDVITPRVEALGALIENYRAGVPAASVVPSAQRRFVTDAQIADFAARQTAAQVAAAIDGAIVTLVNASPAALDTLRELAAALGNDANFAATMAAALAAKAPLASPALTGIPTAPTAAAGTNTTQLATTAFVRAAIAAIVNAAPAALDTLVELSAALGNDANFAATMTTALAGKLPASQFTGANVLALLLAVDGAGSGLDADRLRGAAPSANGLAILSATTPLAFLQGGGMLVTTSSIAADAVELISIPGAAFGAMLVVVGNVDSVSGCLWLRQNATQQCSKFFGGANFNAAGTTVLTGTAGPAGQANFAVATNGQLRVENRTAGARAWQIFVFPQSAASGSA